MTETVIHVVGHMGTDVDHRELPNGTHLSTFRIATTPRHYDRSQHAYVDGITNWLSVQCWRALAVNVSTSLHRGEPVVIVGKLRTQEWTKDGERSSRFILEAIAVGHDLSRGVAVYTKVAPTQEPFPDHTQAAVQAAREVEESAAAQGMQRPSTAPLEHDMFEARRLADAS